MKEEFLHTQNYIKLEEAFQGLKELPMSAPKMGLGYGNYGLGKTIHIKNVTGQISADTLKNVINWQWPTNSIQLQDIQLNFNREKGFSKAVGGLQWGGGPLIYSFGQRQDRMEVPSLKSVIKDEGGNLLTNAIN